MDDKDPPPFGYTFSADFFGGSPSGVDNAGPSLLSEMESQQLTDFFTTGWTDQPAFMPPPEHKDTPDDFWGFTVPPATIHSVSTTIPDQSQLHHGFHNDPTFAMPHPSHTNMFNTQDDIQAASTLFNNAHIHAPQPNGRSHSFHSLPSSSNQIASSSMGSNHGGTFNGMPLVPTPNGLINEQLAAILPNHGSNGTIDAQLAAEFAASPARERHEAELRELGLARPQLKRTYTYGTDHSFNESGFQVSSKEETEEHVTSRLMNRLQHAQQLAPPSANSNGTKLQSPTSHTHYSSSLIAPPTDEEEQSEDGTDNDDEDRHARKKRKTKAAAKNGKRKSVSAATGKNRKASVDDRGKKKRGSVVGQKTQRENLSEEQKRNNHILSEQKRRNLIKRGFDDLHDLVPEIRNGGLSKSGVLVEAANFLDALIADNRQLQNTMGGEGG